MQNEVMNTSAWIEACLADSLQDTSGFQDNIPLSYKILHLIWQLALV